MSKPTRPDVFYVDKRNIADHLTNPEWEDAYVLAESYDELQAENAELRETKQRWVESHTVQYKKIVSQAIQLIRAVELLRDARANAENWVDIDDFLSEMGEPGNENPCPKCGRYHLTECEEDRFLRCVKTRKDLADKCDKLEAENADVRHKNHTLFDEVEKEREEKAELRDQRGHKHYLLTQAVEFLRRYLNDKFYADVAEFLSEMEDTHE